MKAYWQGSISLRQLRVLVAHLPPGNAVDRAELDGRRWTETEALAADIRDAMAALVAMTYNVNRGKGKRAAPTPDPWPRPDLPEAEPDPAQLEYEARVRAELDRTRSRLFNA